ncbi:MAG: peptidoglycan DD-metalloendopeptidase family protein [Acidimicrobiia bacterium]
MRRAIVLGLSAALGVVTAAWPVAWAAPSTAGDAQVAELEAKVGEASQREAAALQDLATVRARRRGLEATVRDLDGKIAASSARMQQARADADRIGGEYTSQQGVVAELEKRLAESKVTYDSAVDTMYRSGGDPSVDFARVFADTRALASVSRQRAYLSGAAGGRRKAVLRFEQERSEAVHRRDLLEGQRRAAQAARDVAEREQAQLARLRAQQDGARRDAAADEAAEAKIVADLQAEKDDYVRQLQALKVVSDTIQNEMARRQAGQKSSAMTFARPVSGAIVSGFGYRVHPIFHTSRLHAGIDLEEPAGVPIRAAAAGVVAIAGPRGGYGNAVVIDHGNRLATVYGHQSRIAVAPGQRVNAGQVIGYVGSTGWATGPHLHFEVRVLGVPVDPTKYL